mmetsp:Transcript_127163/g.271168  ORF Transcript_127163/g.271168 Transcript_127163/m.271168 type:complete len:220 (-) Transcript_127163:387-1046(-)
MARQAARAADPASVSSPDAPTAIVRPPPSSALLGETGPARATSFATIRGRSIASSNFRACTTGTPFASQVTSQTRTSALPNTVESPAASTSRRPAQGPLLSSRKSPLCDTTAMALPGSARRSSKRPLVRAAKRASSSRKASRNWYPSQLSRSTVSMSWKSTNGNLSARSYTCFRSSQGSPDLFSLRHSKARILSWSGKSSEAVWRVRSRGDTNTVCGIG